MNLYSDVDSLAFFGVISRLKEQTKAAKLSFDVVIIAAIHRRQLDHFCSNERAFVRLQGELIL